MAFQKINHDEKYRFGTVADIDGDGVDGLIYELSNPTYTNHGTHNGSAVQVRNFNPATGANSIIRSYTTGNSACVSDTYMAGDFNGDGKSDFYIGKSNSGQIYLSTGSILNSVGWSAPAIPTSLIQLPYSELNEPVETSRVDIGDFNGDGKTGLLSSNRSSGGANWTAQTIFQPVEALPRNRNRCSRPFPMFPTG